MLDVEGIDGVNQSLERLFQTEEIEGVDCETCQKKTTINKGPLISRLPPILTFCLNRITLDFMTMERKKVNSRFEYPLELDMKPYLDLSEETIACQQANDSDLTTYELKSIVIHKGSPYGGHYYAYIRDDLEDGNWHLKMPETFDAKPTEIKPEEKKEESKNEMEQDKDEEKKSEEKEEQKEEKIDWSKLSKAEKKAM